MQDNDLMRWLVVLCLTLLLVPTVSSAPAQPDSQRLLLTVDQLPLEGHQPLVLEAMGVETLETFAVSGTLLVDAPAGADQRLAALPFVLGVQPDDPVEPLLASSRPAAGITDDLYDAGLSGQGVNIALVDSGIDQDHPALEERVIADLAFSEDGVENDAPSSSQHGTHVAGILVGNGAGDQSHHGVAPGSGLVSLDLSKQFTTSNALRAFEWVYENHEAYDIHVVANSWGRQRDQATYDPSDPIIRASDALISQGLVVVFSSGNGGDVPGRMTLEATNPNAITVGAVTDGGNLEPYSSRGPIYDEDGQQADWVKPDLVAPGTRVISTRDGGTMANGYKMMNGTSMAAPHVAGAAALLLSVRPDLSPSQVKGLLLESAKDVEASGVDHGTGHGLLDLRGALRLLDDSEGRTIEHWDIVVEDRGSLTGPSEAGAALEAASIKHTETLPFEVPDNATGVRVTVTWEGREDLKARLVSPAGPVRTQMVSDRAVLEVDDPLPGDWELELSSESLGEGTYDTSVSVGWTERLDGSGLPVDDGPKPASNGFPLVGTTSPFGPSLIPGVPNIVPMIAGGALTVLLVAGRAVMGRRTW